MQQQKINELKEELERAQQFAQDKIEIECRKQRDLVYRVAELERGKL